MKSQAALARLENIVSADLDRLARSMILPDGDRYHVFGDYEIRRNGAGFAVTRRQHAVAEFGSLRSALSWCSADALGKSALALNIYRLEQQRQAELADATARGHAARQSRDPVRRETLMLKAQQRRDRVEQLENQLDNCCNLAKYWQIRGFNNETPRTGRSSSHRTNRPNAAAAPRQ